MSWHLVCTKDGMKKIVTQDGTSMGHTYRIEEDSPLGIAFNNAKSGTYVLHENLPYDGQEGPFCKVLDRDNAAKPLLNGGKEYVLRKLTTMGSELIGNDTCVTHQSFPTRFYKDKNGIIRIFVHFSFCCNGQCYSFDALHHTAFVPANAQVSNAKSFDSVHEDFLEDTRRVFQKICERDLSPNLQRQLLTPVINMEDLYPENMDLHDMHIKTMKGSEKPIEQAIQENQMHDFRVPHYNSMTSIGASALSTKFSNGANISFDLSKTYERLKKNVEKYANDAKKKAEHAQKLANFCRKHPKFCEMIPI